jgi:hypothetical protein
VQAGWALAAANCRVLWFGSLVVLVLVLVVTALDEVRLTQASPLSPTLDKLSPSLLCPRHAHA